ncbi:AraC family transcriptional regulator [Ichthyenterobacterium sp. W332]|uniref:AraC family transcriptional regulator n=1 Tax=Microcosmobacter mediterraneus TaxID=3075607 RepID=A0ABU2YH47_9FLAO|nr:AraC family transcriptional regulator [Ichthyenterobacterium sp. W332]MDT0557024.1 AraC family transcriptional regulator [Ichthyenterobacterium sp. W332]
MNFNIFNSIILAGVIQGIIFGAVVLWSKKYKHKSVFFLASLIITYSLSNFQFYLQDISYLTYEELFRTIYMPWADLTPALLYFYVIFYLYPKRKILKKEYLLFLPFSFTVVLGVLYKVFIRVENKSEPLIYVTAFIRNYVAYYTEIISAILSIIVIVVLLNTLKKYRQEFKYLESESIQLQLSWLKNTLFILMFMVVLWITSVLVDLYIDEISFYPVWLGVAFLIYWLGHLGVYKYGVFEERKEIRRRRNSKVDSVNFSNTKHIIIERLKIFLEEEKRFLNPELSLEKTAEAIGLSQGHLSKIINRELQMSYKDYLNSLRVNEAKSYLKNSEFSNYTLVAIGLEAGFNSKSAFNSSFKKLTGETPSQFKKRHIN